ncbi:glutamine amidotransferase [Propionibacterium cyclohexanicum]|uniref:Imidazole glycerol phosphate synthase subunit HisH n=1 Tax=Propionibacterium cyclohexanicum TaxID=64702 RepID=A0A1H9Q3R8_9ACTN|nr:imidazole glycerol phosphate synthase subunit HisH [Propionibacterium cyclohexanicum]SER55032.1 glutamine amidotransferase [Propionibacterium cyclohexanicum]
MSSGRPQSGAEVGVFDYGSGNLHSACQALEAAGARVHLSSQTLQLERFTRLVVPGVGAFAACMAQLRSAGGVEFIREWVASGRQLLGICVGHQILFERGVEHGREAQGIGIYPGAVTRLSSPVLPHMGWNTVEAAAHSELFDRIGDQRFYFVHSYGAHGPVPEQAKVTWAEHEGDRFIAALEYGPVCSTQFHPEKSGAAGAQLLRNWLARRCPDMVG